MTTGISVPGIRTAVDNAKLAEEMARAREKGALFHLTNPVDNWYCDKCSVFGKGELSCWSCGSTDLDFKYVPRWGGGAQSVMVDENDEPMSAIMEYALADVTGDLS